jgi:signal recognition particle receptor subunit beta
MRSVVALTRPAINLASSFEAYPQYTVYKISKHAGTGPRDYCLPDLKHPEKYEEASLPLKTFFKGIKKEVFFIVCGASIESACALRILEQLKNRKIWIMYVVPERKYLNETERLNERAVFHVLQEYARSGVFEKFFIIDNLQIEKILQEQLTIKEYYSKINDFVASTVHMINVFDNTESELQNRSELSTTSRLATFGVGALESGDIPFFKLDNVEEKEYYFAINKDRLAEQGLLEKVKAYMEKDASNVKINYQIYSTDYDTDYVYTVLHTSEIQKST